MQYIVKSYNLILRALKLKNPQQQEEVLKDQTPFFKFYFKVGKRDLANNSLDIGTAPTGQELAKAVEPKTRPDSGVYKLATPNKKSSYDPYYGGDPNDDNRIYPTGLGS